MADIAKSGKPSLATLEPGYEHALTGLRAGEALTDGDLVYIKASDNRVYKATGAAANAAADVRGMVLQDAAVGDGVSIWSGIVVAYGNGLTVSAKYYLSGATAGALADGASTGGTVPIAYAIDGQRIKLVNL